jgi:hypothetical protein
LIFSLGCLIPLVYLVVLLSWVCSLAVAPMDLCVGVCLVSCGLVAAVMMFVGCRQFLGIVEAGTWFRYLKKTIVTY